MTLSLLFLVSYLPAFLIVPFLAFRRSGAACRTGKAVETRFCEPV